MRKIIRKHGVLLIAIVMFLNLLVLIPPKSVCAEETEAKQKYDFVEFPEAVNAEELKSVLARIDTDEDKLNSIKYYLGKDQCQMLLFPYDVKFADSEGVVRDKSNKLYATERGFENKDNNIVSFFPNYLESGIKTTVEGHELYVIPQSNQIGTQRAILEDNTITYKSAFGEDVDLCYKATFTGNKSDIIINSPVEQNEFSFTVISKTLSLSQNDQGCALFCGQDKICDFGDILVYDAIGQTAFGTISVSDDSFTVVAPKDFMESPNTVYPVTVDPALIFTTASSYGESFIVTSYMESTNLGTGGTLSNKSSLRLGYLTNTKYYRIVVQFPFLKAFLDNFDFDISSVGFSLARATQYPGTTNTTVYAYALTVGWDTGVLMNSTTYTTLFNSGNSLYCATSNMKANASASGWNGFNITTIVNQWKNGYFLTNNKVNGLNIRFNSTSNPLTFFHGATTATPNKMPQLTINYTYSYDFQEGIYMLSPYSSLTGASPYNLTCTSNTSSALQSGSISTQNYPSTNPGYISYIHNTAQLFRIKRATYGNGYTIQCLGNGKYLTQSNTSASYSPTEDHQLFHTNWYILPVGEKFYITSFWDAFLTCDTPVSANGNVYASQSNTPEPVYWSLKLYMLDVEHIFQTEGYTCGVASARMTLSYFGVETSTFTDDYLWQYGLYLTHNQWYTHNMPVYPGPQYADPNIQYRPAYGVEQVAKTVIHFLEGTYYENSYSMNLLYFSPYSQTILTNAVIENIAEGYPMISLMKNSSATTEFHYTTTGHFLVIAGIYSDLSGNYRAVLVDPHYNTDPSVGMTNAIIDIAMDDFYLLTTYAAALIRHTN